MASRPLLTPEAALLDGVHVFPAFRDFWDAPDNLFRNDGTFTLCGVYCQLSWFVREGWRAFTEADWRAFAALAADHFDRAPDGHSAFGACLIENLEGEAFSHMVGRYFDPRVLTPFQFGA